MASEKPVLMRTNGGGTFRGVCVCLCVYTHIFMHMHAEIALSYSKASVGTQFTLYLPWLQRKGSFRATGSVA